MIPAMSENEFNAALAALKFNHASFARMLGRHPRTVRRWRHRGIPPEIAALVRLMVRMRVTARHQAPADNLSRAA